MSVLVGGVGAGAGYEDSLHRSRGVTQLQDAAAAAPTTAHDRHRGLFEDLMAVGHLDDGDAVPDRG